MSDRYVHLQPLAGKWDHRQDNLVTLGRHLVMQADAIIAAGGLAFSDERMADLPPPTDVAEGRAGATLPPLAHGPAAGLAPQAGEDWLEYCERVFGIGRSDAFLGWVQSPMWQKTDPAPVGAGLRIAYVLDYGVPHDHVEIAMGQAYTDYDSNGFLLERLRLDDVPDRSQRSRRPAWVGAVELQLRHAETRPDFLLPPGEVPFSAGLPASELAALEARIGGMPGIFHDFLLFSGRRTTPGEAGVYADRLDAIHRMARARIFAGGRDEDDPVPANAIFIGMADGRHFEFILGGDRTDSPVFVFDSETGQVSQTGNSIFSWIARFMQTATPPPGPPDEAADGARAGDSGPESVIQRLLRRLFG